MRKIVILGCKKLERKQWKQLKQCQDQDHISMVNQLYLGQSFNGKKTAQQMLTQKWQSYKNQDRKKINMQMIL